MKLDKISLGIGIVAIVIALLALVNQKNITKEIAGEEAATKNLKTVKIAYVNIDTVLNNYDLYNILMLQFAQKQQEYEKQLNSKMLSLQRRSYELQQKYAQHLITTATYQKEGQKLLDEQQKLAEWQQKKALELQEDQTNITLRVYDSVLVAVKEFNKNANYDLIFSNNITATGRSLLYANPAYDITDTIISILNERHSLNMQDSLKAK